MKVAVIMVFVRLIINQCWIVYTGIKDGGFYFWLNWIVKLKPLSSSSMLVYSCIMLGIKDTWCVWIENGIERKISWKWNDFLRCFVRVEIEGKQGRTFFSCQKKVRGKKDVFFYWHRHQNQGVKMPKVAINIVKLTMITKRRWMKLVPKLLTY